MGLKRLIEVVRDSGGTLSVVLAGHPKLKNDLRRPSMEEIGSRATIFELEGGRPSLPLRVSKLASRRPGGDQRKYPSPDCPLPEAMFLAVRRILFFLRGRKVHAR